MTATTAADQLKRLLTLIPHLADGEAHPIADIATILGASPGQIIDDLRVLVDRYDLPGGFVEGVQIYLDAETVSATTPHFNRPMRLTMSELCALELGLAIVKTERPPDDLAAVDGALERLRSVISTVTGDERREGVVTASTAVPGVSPDHLAALNAAIRERRKARILYRSGSATGAEERTVCPYSLAFVSGMWYLVAHCERVEALRVFRLDRVSEVARAEGGYDVPEDYSVEQALERARALMPAESAEVMRVRYSPGIAKWIAEREGLTLNADGSVVVEHPLMDDQWAVRHVLQYGPEAEVVAPQRIRTAILEVLSQPQDVRAS